MHKGRDVFFSFFFFLITPQASADFNFQFAVQRNGSNHGLAEIISLINI